MKTVSGFDAIDRVIGAIYDEITRPEPWIVALEGLRTMMDANVACLRLTPRPESSGIYLFAAGPLASSEAIKEWEAHESNAHEERLRFDMEPGHARIYDWKTEAVVPAYRALLDKYNIGASMTTMLPDTEMTGLLFVSRGVAQPMFDATELQIFQAMSGHFARAADLRRELLTAEAKNDFQAEAIDSLAIGALIIGPDSTVAMANATAQAMVQARDGLALIRNQLHATDPRDDQALKAAMQTVIAQDRGSTPPVRALSIQRPSGKRDLGLVVARRDMRNALSNRPETCIVVFIRDMDTVARDDTELYQQLFAFTQSEARLAMGLASGASMEAIERKLNIRHNTGRAHLRAMFLKAGVSRQAELVRVLVNCVAPLGHPADKASAKKIDPV